MTSYRPDRSDPRYSRKDSVWVALGLALSVSVLTLVMFWPK